jgi:hypothetical protein
MNFWWMGEKKCSFAAAAMTHRHSLWKECSCITWHRIQVIPVQQRELARLPVVMHRTEADFHQPKRGVQQEEQGCDEIPTPAVGKQINAAAHCKCAVTNHQQQQWRRAYAGAYLLRTISSLAPRGTASIRATAPAIK